MSGTGAQRNGYYGPLDTFEITRDRIAAITLWGNEEVFDLQVEGTENFIANGLVSHNTRWHRDDLAGRLLREAREFDAEPWEVVKLPALAGDNDPLGRQPGEALWPARYPIAALRAHQRDPYWWAALYQQEPVAEGSSEWPDDYFDHADFWFQDWPADLAIRTLALDPSKGRDAKSGDYSAFVRFGRDGAGTEYVEADLAQGRDAEAIVDAGVEHVKTFHPDGFAIEENAFQHLFAPLFRAKALATRTELPIYLMNNTVNKQVRIRRLTEPLKAKCIRFRDTPGTRLLVSQLRDWPQGVFDDGPDALEIARRLAIDLHNRGPLSPGVRHG